MWTSEHQQRRCFAFGLIAVTTWGPSHHTIPPPPSPRSVVKNEWLAWSQRTDLFFLLFLNLGKNFYCENNKKMQKQKKNLTAGPNLNLSIVFSFIFKPSYFSWASWLRRLVISKQKISLKGIWDESHFFLKLWKKKKSHNACWVLTDWIITGCVCVEILIMPLVFFCL